MVANGAALLGVLALAVGFDVVLFARGAWYSMLVVVALAVIARTWFLRVGLLGVSVGPVSIRLVDATLAQTFERAEVGGLGYDGAADARRLSGRWSRPGRLVVLDPWGRVLAARPAVGLSVRKLARAAESQGIRWVGVAPVELDELAPTGWPAGVPSPDGAPGLLDGRAAARLRSEAAAVRRRALAYATATAIVLVGGWSAARWTGPTIAVDLVRAACVLVFVDAALELGQVALTAWQVRTARRILAAAPWQPVEAVLVQGAPADRGTVASVVVQPGTGSVIASYLVEGGPGGWPPPTRRGWFLLAAEPSGRRAVLAEPDRAELAVVRAQGGFLRAEQIHRWARSQVADAILRA